MVSRASRYRVGFAPGKRQNFVRAHARVRGAAEDLQSQASSDAFTGLVPSLANPSVIPGQLEFDFRMRQKTQPVTDLLRDGDLALAGDLHGNTPTGKCNTCLPKSTNWEKGTRRFPPLRGKERPGLRFPMSTTSHPHGEKKKTEKKSPAATS